MGHDAISVTPGTGESVHTSTRVLGDGRTVDTQHVVLSGADGSQSTRVVSVTDTRGALVTLLADRIALMLHNDSAVTVYLGGSDVTADDTAGTGGWKLRAGEKLALGFSSAVTIHAVTASGTATVRVWQVS